MKLLIFVYHLCSFQCQAPGVQGSAGEKARGKERSAGPLQAGGVCAAHGAGGEAPTWKLGPKRDIFKLLWFSCRWEKKGRRPAVMEYQEVLPRTR